MLKRILSVSITAALAFGWFHVVAATVNLNEQTKTKKESPYFRLDGSMTIETCVNKFPKIMSSNNSVIKSFPDTVNDPKRLAILKKKPGDQICITAGSSFKNSSKELSETASVEIRRIEKKFNPLVERIFIVLNKINMLEAEQDALLIPILNTGQDVPVGELREGIRPRRRYPKEELIDDDVEEMSFEDEAKLQDWLNAKAREKRLLRSLIPIKYGTSLFIFVSDGASTKSNPYRIHRLNNQPNKVDLVNLLKQHRSRVFVGIHQLEGSYLIVFRDEK